MGQFQLHAAVSGAIRIGADPKPPNKPTITITNRGSDIKQGDFQAYALRIEGGLGPEAANLFLDNNDFNQCTLKLDSSSDWSANWSAKKSTAPDGKTFCVELSNASDDFLAKNKAVNLTLEGLLSRTAGGSVCLTVTLKLGEDDPSWSQTLEIEKEKAFTGINYFYSEPSERAEHLPGTSVTLHWLTSNLDRLKLQRNNKDVACDFTEAPGSKTQAVGTDGVVNFTLGGYETGPDLRHESTLSLNVVPRGWHDVELVLQPGDPGYPSAAEATAARAQGGIKLTPTTIALAPDNRVFGIFRCRAGGSERFLLFSTDNPRGVWSLVDEQVPSAFATSPAVIVGGKLWLVGGSRIQQEQTSSQLCCRDLGQRNNWRNLDLAGNMPPRMGHGVVWFENRVWVMGGRDRGGNALNDVWSFDPNAETPVWRRETEHADWSPRCLISPVVFNKKIWFFGGAEEPDSDHLFADIWCGNGERWTECGTPGFLTKTKLTKTKLTPLGGALQVLNGKLVLIGRGRWSQGTSDEIRQFYQQLDSATSSTWRTLKADALADWGPYVTFACTLVGWTRSHETGSDASHLLLALALGPNDDKYSNQHPLKFYLD